jgi:pyruvate kinase
VKAVETLDAIIRDAEVLPPLAVASVARLMHAEHGRALCEAAVTLADRGEADAIVAVTAEGKHRRACSRRCGRTRSSSPPRIAWKWLDV